VPLVERRNHAVLAQAGIHIPEARQARWVPATVPATLASRGVPRAGTTAALQAGLPGGTCPGGVAGAEAAKLDPDPAVVGALIRDCPFLPGGAGRD
jgi:hypothetical protein